MNAALACVLVLPFPLALLPALLPAATTPRRLGWCAVLAASVTLGLAVWSSVAGGVRTDVPAGWWLCWRDDPTARTLALLPPACWLLVAVRALHPGDAIGNSGGRWRRWPIGAQLATACAMALCRADLLACWPLLVGAMLLLGNRLDGWNRVEQPSWLVSVPVMASGVAILSARLGVPARWDLLVGTGGRQQAVGLLLLLLPVLLLAIAASIRPALVDRTTTARGLLRMLLLVVAVSTALRVRSALPSGAIADLVLPVGLGWIVLSLILVPACRSLAQRVSLAACVQSGAALVAIGAGGPGGTAACIMLVACLALLLPLALAFAVDNGSARLRGAAIVAMVGVPPFGPFAAGLVLLVRCWRDAPVLAALLLLAAGLSALSVLGGLAREPVPAAGGRITPFLVCAAIVLLLLLWLGLAMPSALSDWLLSVGGAGA